jgi:hypothetical protein
VLRMHEKSYSNLCSKKILTDQWEYKRLCKYEKISIFSVQMPKKMPRRLNCSSLFSCIHDNHFKQLRKCSYNVTVLAHYIC